MNINNLIVRHGLIMFEVNYASKKRRAICVRYTSIGYCNYHTVIWREEFHSFRDRRMFSLFPVFNDQLPLGTYKEDPAGSKIFDEILDYVDKNT